MNDNNINNEVNTTEPIKRKVTKTDLIIGIIFILILVFVFLYCLNTYTDILKPKNKTEVNTTTTSVVTTNSNVSGDISTNTVNKIESSLNGVFADTLHVAGKEYLDDYDFKFAFLVYFYSWESENIENGENGTTGLFTMDLTTFNNFYFRAYGEQFDISKLNMNSSFYKGVKYPSISENKIHSSFYTGVVPQYYAYKNKNVTTSDGLKNVIYSYGSLIDSGFSEMGSFTVKVFVDPKGFISFKSFISSK